MRRAESGLLGAMVRLSIRFRGIVISLALLLLGLGLFRLAQARYDVFPEFAPPQVVIQTQAPGLSPEQVEVIVTHPIEGELSGIQGLASLRSASIQGLSLITLTFDPDSDVLRDRQAVSERLGGAAGRLPQALGPPVMTPLTSSTSVILVLGLTSGTRSLMDLRTIADWTVRPRLLAVAGVAKVSTFGGEERQLQVRVDPDLLIRFNLGMTDVLDAARRAVGPRGMGNLYTPNQQIVLQAGSPTGPEAVAETILAHHRDAALTLGDVARIAYGSRPPSSAASVMGDTGVALVVSEQFGANTLEVTQRVEAALRDLGPGLRADGVRLYPDLFRPASFVQTAIRNVRTSVLLGGALVTAVLFLFLLDMRTAAISIFAIPLSLLAAVISLRSLGFTLNTMTLGGLAIAIGEVVDDAVIDVENIVRRLGENRRRENGLPAWRVVLDASLEVRGAVVYATFAVILVFLPILTLTGIAGRLFAPLGLAYILAVLASLLVALTVTPALSMVLLGNRPSPEGESPVLRWCKARYRFSLGAIAGRPRAYGAALAVLLAAGVGTLPFFGSTFLPELKEGNLIVHMSAVPGTSLEESLRIGRQVSRSILKLPAVRRISQRVGRAEASDDVLGSHYSEFNLELKPAPGEDAESTVASLRKRLSEFAGVSFAVKTFLTERVEETLSGYTAAVVVNIYGNDLDVLDEKAREVLGILRQIPGAIQTQASSAMEMPELVVSPRPADLLRWGFSPAEILDTVSTAYQGEVVGQMYEGNRVVDVSVILPPDRRTRTADVGRLSLRSAEGTYVRLEQLADVYERSGRYQILHEGARRVQTVTCDVSGRDVSSFVRDAKRRILSRLSLPRGAYVEFTGSAAAESRARRDLYLYGLAAAIGILLLLFAVVRHWRNVALILINLPFALLGGVLVVFATGGVLSLGSMIGFVTLFGITLRTSILLLSHYEHLVRIEGRAWGLETALRGAMDRLAPILMTSLVTALGLLPLAVGMGAPGREIEGPLALVILGGLVTSMVLNLLFLPVLAARFGSFPSGVDEDSD